MQGLAPSINLQRYIQIGVEGVNTSVKGGCVQGRQSLLRVLDAAAQSKPGGASDAGRPSLLPKGTGLHAKAPWPIRMLLQETGQVVYGGASS